MKKRSIIRIAIYLGLITYLFVSDSYLARRLVQLPELLLNIF